MDKETQLLFKEILTKRLNELLAEAEKTVAGMTDTEETFRTRPIGQPSNQTGIFSCAFVTGNGSSL